jgi:hypothetical protein
MGKTRVAVLGSIAEFHVGAVAFNLEALFDLVVDIHPDLLCLDIPPGVWDQKSLDELPPEYRDALLPLAERSDIVIVPIGDIQIQPLPKITGWRGAAIGWLQALLAALQRNAPSPLAVNYGWRHDLANGLYYLIDRLDQTLMRESHRTHTQHLIERIRQAVRRDPEAKILAVVNVRYCHHIRPALREDEQIEVVPFTEL